jgi:ATP-dependent exoDNAse (exonuclease V) alpha subunit
MKTDLSRSNGRPFKHVSIRIPWHDSKWAGSVCEHPRANAACLALERIHDEKNDEAEERQAGKLLPDIDPEDWPVCVSERGTFMAPFEIIRTIKHPYSETSDLHKHILPTPFRHPPYSAPALPFRWMRTKYAWQLAEELGLECNRDWEPELPFDTAWVQDYRNQKALLDHFFSLIKPKESLCFFYAKQTPLAEGNRRVLVGVGRVLHVSSSVEYNYSTRNGLRCLIWERAVQHSVRPDFMDGFVLPYQDILVRSEKDQSINPADYLAYAPEDRYIEFSYATEHVTHDGAIDALISCATAIRKISQVVHGSYQEQLRWIDRRLLELWKRRGAYPGLAATLSAFGVTHSHFLSDEIFSRLGENEDPWPLVDEVFKNSASLPKELASQIGSTLQSKWKKLPDERKSLLKLLSRFEITVDHATRFYVEEERTDSGIKCLDSDLLANPYLLYELDRFTQDPISISTVDRGMFPEDAVRKKHPIPKPSSPDGPMDCRRVRALVVYMLEEATENGNTLLPETEVIKSIRDLPIQPNCPIDHDLLSVVEDDFSPTIVKAKMKNEERAYQLERLSKMGEIVRKTVNKRLEGKRHSLTHGSTEDWSELLLKELKDKGAKLTHSEDERNAQEEKIAALKELAESRFSVLTGPAGTGKTKFVISALCHHPEISRGQVLLLAPTGKARVRMQQATEIPAQTIAQFLRGLDRFDETTGSYRLSDKEKIDAYKTVIVDEASMLTEEQLGALLDSLSGVDRFVLAGDPKQLPPIGAGRPFVDIIARLVPPNVETIFPRIGSGYTELTVRLRQTGESRDDLELADWFSGRNVGPGGDEIFNRILKDERLEHLKLIRWEIPEEITERLLDALVNELGLSSQEDIVGFELSLGGRQSNKFVYFNKGVAEAAENWQILSPVKGYVHGVKDVNRLVQKTFRTRTIELANNYRRKAIPKPLGPDGIVYGDKVINTSNNRRYGVFPPENALKYVANGEVGIVVGRFRRYDEKWKGALPVNVEFSSQPGFVYTYGAKDFKEEASPILELAYAITIHKAQGSDFEICFLILPNECRLLSKELLYTALTRQRDRLVILHQGNWTEFKKYSSDFYSETARRFTNLFVAPTLVPVEDRFFEEHLIHRTRRGETVRSKSEVIIADNLSSKNIAYSYEKQLVGKDGTVRYPDFTVEDESGTIYYWEHLGMFYEESYRIQWEKKLDWYKSQDILPYEAGGGKKGILVVTKDTKEGGIDSEEIKKLIEKIFAF